MLDGRRVVLQPLLEVAGLRHRPPGLGEVGEQRLDARRRVPQRVDRSRRQACGTVIGEADQAIQRLGQREPDLHAGHRHAAVERVARAVELLRHRVRRRRPVAGGDVPAQHREVTRHLAREDVEEHGIDARRRGGFDRDRGLHRFRRRSVRSLRHRSCNLGINGGQVSIALGLRRGWRRLCLREGPDLGHEAAEVCARRGAHLELLEQRRQRGDGLVEHRQHLGAAPDGAVDHAVQEALDAPAVLADQLRAHHAAAALQRVEGAAQGGSAVPSPSSSSQAGKSVDAVDRLAGLLDEELEEFGIEASCPPRRPWWRRFRGLGRRGRDHRVASNSGGMTATVMTIVAARSSRDQAGDLLELGLRPAPAASPSRQRSALSSI